MCLDHSAHGLVPTHEIFQAPYKVDIRYEEVPTPEHYRNFWHGRKLGKTMKAWRVQKKGYVQDRDTPAGVVAGGWGFADSPDAEVIAGGFNTKGPRYVALGRHGPFFQWGFSAAPSEMTEAGRRAFVNSIRYIARFDRQPPLTHKKRGAFHRGYMLDRAVRLGKLREGYQKTVDFYENRKKRYIAAQAVKQAGERALTAEEKFALKYEPRKPMSWEAYQDSSLRRYPSELVKRLGKTERDYPKYLDWTIQNLGYFKPAKGGAIVDLDARALGISNRDVAILDKAISLLSSSDEAEEARAQRLLTRYTDQKWTRVAEWRAWLERERSFLFFSDWDGYRFHSSRISLNEQRKRIERGPGAPAPTQDKPVTYSLSLLGTPKPGATVTLALHMSILEGWHAYATVPANSAYPATEFELSLPKGATALGKWNLPRTSPSLEDPGLTHYIGDLCFLREVRLGKGFVPGSKVVLEVTWQACDEQQCLPPDARKLEIAVGK